MRIKSYGIKTYDINGYVLHTIRIAFRATNENRSLNIMTLCKKIAQSNLDLKYNYLEVYENNTNRIS